MGPFGGSHYSLCFFIPLHPKLPPSYDSVRPEVASLADAWNGLGLTYFLLKGLRRTSKTLKLIGDTAEGYSKKDVPDMGMGGTSGTLTSINSVSARPVKLQSTASFRSRTFSQNAGHVSSHPRACESSTSGICRGEQRETLTDSLQHFSVNGLCEAATSSSDEFRLVTEKSLRGFGLGLEGVRTTIIGLSQQAHSKNEVKEIVTVVRTADRLVEGVKAARGIVQTFTSPVGDALHALGAGGNGVLLALNTVRIVLKGVKISKGLITVTKWCKGKHTGAFGVAADMATKANQKIGSKRFKAIVKGLKASEGAVNVVNMTKEVGRALGMLDKVDHLLSWSVIMKGFKFTKSAIRVLEPLGDLPLGVISVLGKGMLELKGAVEGFSIVMKAVALSKELYMVLLKGIGFTQGAVAAFNEFHWRTFLTKHLEEEYSQRTEINFKGLCHNQQLAMPTIICSSTKAESKCSNSRLKFIGRSCPTKEVAYFIKTQELLEDTSPLPLSFLTLASCFDCEPCLEVFSQPG